MIPISRNKINYLHSYMESTIIYLKHLYIDKQISLVEIRKQLPTCEITAIL